MTAGPDKSGGRVRIVNEEVLADDWARLTKYRIAITGTDGAVEEHVRQVYDRGNGAVILPVDRSRGTVLLVRQFRMPVFLNPRHAADREGMLIEACAGLLDENDPETAIRKEAEEELGYRLGGVERLFDVYMSPGSVSERLSFFIADYSPADRISAGGGAAHEGEDIEVMEVPLDEALAMIGRGKICDAKTIILLQHAQRMKAAGP
jgi:nudix-type nucleoside diphosphatase (YffH/AdpP family)